MKVRRISTKQNKINKQRGEKDRHRPRKSERIRTKQQHKNLSSYRPVFALQENIAQVAVCTWNPRKEIAHSPKNTEE